MEKVLNDYHSGACGGHLSGLATTQKILHAGYYWPTIFKDCMNVVKKCHLFHVFTNNMCAHPAPLFPVIAVGPFSRWGINFTTCTPTSAEGHRYIIVGVDYFTKWVEAMPTIKNDSKMTTIFIFDQIITRFRVPR